ncbi:MAG: hypothetical protein Q4Q22_05015 [Methanosphaera sp.]|nr:hypothetical protein [Methanosphaera sp.]
MNIKKMVLLVVVFLLATTYTTELSKENMEIANDNTKIMTDTTSMDNNTSYTLRKS